ncbi:MAG TPA: response regulator [Planctomycetota bacterium]|nr:response regulator [Planctomycetota bacterium]
MSDPGLLLMVEDNPDEVDLMREALQEAGITIPMRVLGNGEEAIQYLSGQGKFEDRERHPLPTLIILDLKLPLRSGLEVLQWVKTHPELRGIPVVIFTSSSEAKDLKRSYELGVNSYLVKPQQFTVLVELVRALGNYWLGYNRAPR